MKVIIDGCKTMARTLNLAVVLVHHTNKEGFYERGSGILRNSADTLIKIERQDDIVRVSSEKTKDDKPFDTYYLAPVIVNLGIDDDGEPETSLVLVSQDNVEFSETLTDKMLQTLQVIHGEGDLSIRDMQKILNLSYSTVQRCVKRLEDSGFLTKSGNNRTLTDKGLKAIG
jgi:predicted transcriptional regulator